jgi:hypothetical protein
MPVSDIDIWRAAKLLLDQHGKQAAIEAAQRSNRAMELQDQANYETWQRIAMAILDLQRRKVLDGESIH